MNLKKIGSEFEIIVVDDGSHDLTTKLVEELIKKNKNIRLVSDGKNYGRGHGRYLGVKKSNGRFVCMVDADIILPNQWLSICMRHIEKYEVVGGIAVPDGDVAYIYRRFKLKPKRVMGSTTITGNNGLYRRSVVNSVNFDPKLREGEDVDFNYRVNASGATTLCIPNLFVEHQEHKSFFRSMFWLYQSGVGASRQLIRFKKIRLPDIAFFMTLATAAFGVIFLTLTDNILGLILPFISLLGTSILHLRRKFEMPFSKILAVLGALIVNTILVFCYYIGRFVGLVVYLINPDNQKKNDNSKVAV